MSWKVVNLVADKRVGSPARKLVLIAMADRANPDGSGVYASFATIADMAEISRPTAKRIIKEFSDEGLIRHVGERECRYGTTNVYDLDVTAIEALPASAAASERTKEPRMNRVQFEPGKETTGITVPLTRFKMTPKPTPKPTFGSKEPQVSLSEATKEPENLFGEKRKAATKPKKRSAYPAEFEQFWRLWPKGRRELSNKQKAAQRWQDALGRWDAELLMSAARRYLATPSVKKENFQYCCLAEVFLNGKLESAVEAVLDVIDEPKREVWDASLMAYVEAR